MPRHFRPLKRLQVTDSALLKVIVVRIHAGEPRLCFQSLGDFRVRVLHECRFKHRIAYCRVLLLLWNNLNSRLTPEHGIHFGFEAGAGGWAEPRANEHPHQAVRVFNELLTLKKLG